MQYPAYRPPVAGCRNNEIALEVRHLLRLRFVALNQRQLARQPGSDIRELIGAEFNGGRRALVAINVGDVPRRDHGRAVHSAMVLMGIVYGMRINDVRLNLFKERANQLNGLVAFGNRGVRQIAKAKRGVHQLCRFFGFPPPPGERFRPAHRR